MAETNFKVFAERASASELPTDEAYLSDEVRLGGNKAGSIARSAPNNKALKQATLAATALAEYTALKCDENITDDLSAEQLTEKVNQAITAHIDTDTTNSTKLVHTGGDETITGVKTFSALPESGVTPIKDQQFVTKKYSDDQDKEVLKAAKEYTDIEVSNALQEAKDYADKLSDETLQAAKDYTDKQLADGGGAGGTGGAVLAPNIISPANGAEDVIITTAFTASEFRSAYAENTRTTRQFQVTKTTWDECEIDVEINADAYSPLERLEANHDYKWRCRDKSSFGITSPWSTEAAFETGGELFVNQPVIEVEGGTSDIKETPLLNGSIFSVNQGEDTHQATDWRIKRTSDGTIVWQSQNDTEHLTSIEVPSGYLRPSTQYTAEVRYKGAAYNWSKWSTPVTFTTSNVFDSIQAPTVSITGEPSNVSATPTISGSAFMVITEQGTEDTHEATDWLIKQGGRIVWQSLNNTSNKESITVPRGNLSTSTAYTAEVRYKGAKLGYSAYGSKAFNTKAQFPAIAAPSLTVTGTPDKVPESPTLTASAFTISNGDEGQQDTHQMTDWLVMDELGTSEVWSSKNDTSNLTTIRVPKEFLQEGTKYQFKVRYKGTELGWSQYTTVEGTTKVKFAEIKTPTLELSKGDSVEEVFNRFMVFTSDFAAEEDSSEDAQVHVSTSWRLFEKSNTGTAVWESLNDTVNKVSVQVDYNLKASTEYVLTCVMHGNGETVSGEASIEFTSSEIPTGYLEFTTSFKAPLAIIFGTTLDIIEWDAGSNIGTVKANCGFNSEWINEDISQFVVNINGSPISNFFDDKTYIVPAGSKVKLVHRLKEDAFYPLPIGYFQHRQTESIGNRGAIRVFDKPFPKLSRNGKTANVDNNGYENFGTQLIFGHSVDLESIPDAPFRHCNFGPYCGETFARLTKLKELPRGFFMHVTSDLSSRALPSLLARNGFSMFCYRMTSITKIPKEFFKAPKAIRGVDDFRQIFEGCTSLTTVPDDLFSYFDPEKTQNDLSNYESAILSADSAFQDCKALKTIPEHLFDKLTEHFSFHQIFANCTSLTTLPIDSFMNVATHVPTGRALDFEQLVYDCTSLSVILRFKATNNANVAELARGSKGGTGTLYVPRGSTFYTALINANANSDASEKTYCNIIPE